MVERATRQRNLVLAAAAIGLAMMCLPIRSAQAQACSLPATTNLVSHWTGDTLDGAADTVGSNDATLSNGALAGTAPALFGESFFFDGVDDFAENAGTLPTTGTMLIWVRPTSLKAGKNPIAGTAVTSSAPRFQIAYHDSAGGSSAGPFDTVALFGENTAASPTELTENTPTEFRVDEWALVAATWDYANDSYALLVDGQNVGTLSGSGAENAPDGQFRFGADEFAGSDYFHGNMDEIRIYDSILLDCEIQAVYEDEAPDQDSDLVADKDDNCQLHANGPNELSNQVDTDLDGYGNRCDQDVTQDGFALSSDLTSLFGSIGSSSLIHDFDGDGNVLGTDFTIFVGAIGSAPGPSGLPCADATMGQACAP